MAKIFEGGSEFASNLPEGSARFLSQVMQHALADEWRTPEDFLRHFGPDSIMEALQSADDLRAKLLIEGANVHEKIAKKKKIGSCSEDLQLALDEGITTPAQVLELFPSDERVRYLDSKLVWDFLFEDEFWKTTPEAGKQAHARAAARLTYMLQRALEQDLITLQDIADGMTFEEISERLPVAELQKVVTHAMQRSRSGVPLTEEELLEVVPLGDLVAYVPLEQAWSGVVIDKIALPAGLTEGMTEASSEAAPESEKQVGSKKPKKKPKKAEPEPKQAAEPPPLAADEASVDVEVEVDASAPEASAPGSAEEEARTKAVDRLRQIERLPPRHTDLPTPILLSIDSMYAELLQMSSDEEREECIRDSFPNEVHMRQALLALIELLDPSINIEEPPISEADIDALIRVVLFEERQRYERGQGAKRKASVPPPLPSQRKGSSVPPPLPPDRKNVST